jgi:uroporphyrinogen decarboxylase
MPCDAVSILVSDDLMQFEAAGPNLGLSYQDILERRKSNIPLLQDKSLFAKFQLTDLKRGERIHYFTEIVRRAAAAMPGVLLDTVFSIQWGTATRLRGIENLIFDTMDDPGFVQALLQFAYEYNRMVVDALVEAGTGMVTFGAPTAGCSVISPTMFRELARPSFDRIFSHVRSRTQTPICLHICGYTDPIIEDLVGLNVDVLSIDAPTSLKKAAEASRGRVAIEGNFPGELYIDGPKDAIEAKVKESIAIAAVPNAYKYILCSGCQIPDNTPVEHIQHFLECGRRYQRYDQMAALPVPP